MRPAPGGGAEEATAAARAEERGVAAGPPVMLKIGIDAVSAKTSGGDAKWRVSK